MRVSSTLSSLLFLVLVACSGQKEAPAPSASGGTAPTVAGGDAKKEARDIFANRCTPCHGARGAGDGPASAGLTPKPRNFQDGGWQKTITDEHIEKIIKYGGAAVGKSAAMPANPDLNGKPAVVAELRTLVRDLAQ